MAKKTKSAVSDGMRLACSNLSVALIGPLADVLAATDRFYDRLASLKQPEYDGAMELLKGIRDSWNLLSWYSEEAAKISSHNGGVLE